MPDADGNPTIDELPDRVALRRRIAEKIAYDQREYAADDPERTHAIGGQVIRVSALRTFGR